MTKQEANEILSYVADNILSPMADEERPAKEIWLELIKEPFNNLCNFVNEKVNKPIDNE